MAEPSTSYGKVFVSYRREDAAYPAGWLCDRLGEKFGKAQIFQDIDSIELGDDFIEKITTAVASCDVLLAVIGKRWMTITDKHGRRRLDQPDDFVRLEIEAALGRHVRVIPILVDGAEMPDAAELPPSLADLVRRNALQLSPSRFDYDTGRLLAVVESTLAALHASEDPGGSGDQLGKGAREPPLRPQGNASSGTDATLYGAPRAAVPEPRAALPGRGSATTEAGTRGTVTGKFVTQRQGGSAPLAADAGVQEPLGRSHDRRPFIYGAGAAALLAVALVTALGLPTRPGDAVPWSRTSNSSGQLAPVPERQTRARLVLPTGAEVGDGWRPVVSGSFPVEGSDRLFLAGPLELQFGRRMKTGDVRPDATVPPTYLVPEGSWWRAFLSIPGAALLLGLLFGLAYAETLLRGLRRGRGRLHLGQVMGLSGVGLVLGAAAALLGWIVTSAVLDLTIVGASAILMAASGGLTAFAVAAVREHPKSG